MRSKDVVRNSPYLSERCKEQFLNSYTPPYSAKKLYNCLCSALKGEDGCDAFIDSVCSIKDCPMSIHAASRRIKKDTALYNEMKTAFEGILAERRAAAGKKEAQHNTIPQKDDERTGIVEPKSDVETVDEECGDDEDASEEDEKKETPQPKNESEIFSAWVVKVVKEETDKIRECVELFEEQMEKMKDYIEKLGELTPSRPMRIIGEDPVQKIVSTPSIRRLRERKQ